MPIGESGAAFVAIVRDQEVLDLIAEKAHSFGSRLTLETLIAELADAQIACGAAAHLAIFDAKNDRFSLASIGAPAVLCKNRDGEIITLSKPSDTLSAEAIFHTGCSEIATLFFTLDPKLPMLVENHLPFSFSRREIDAALEGFTSRRDYQYLFLNHEIAQVRLVSISESIDAKLNSIKRYEAWLEARLEKYVPDDEEATNTILIFNELIVNAYEHGSLGIDKVKKQEQIEQGTYDDYVQILEQQHSGQIHIKIDFYREGFLIAQITNEGVGFDFNAQIEAHEEFETSFYRGRGILMAQQNSAALFYTNSGRSVIFIVRCKQTGAPKSSFVDETLLKSITVLYAEDDEYIRNHVNMLLKRAVKNLLLAENGSEALELFKRYRPDIVVTDVEMPMIGGLELSRKIREISRDVPIVVTTAHNDEDFFLQAIDAEVDKFLIKPVRVPIMRNVLNRFARSIYLQKAVNLNLGVIDTAKLKLFCRDETAQIPSLKVKATINNAIYGVIKLDDMRSLLFVASASPFTLVAYATLLNLLLRSRDVWEAVAVAHNEIEGYLLEYETINSAFAVYNAGADAIAAAVFGEADCEIGGISAVQNPLLSDGETIAKSIHKLTDESTQIVLACRGAIVEVEIGQ
ncbi:hypothetical protein AGMMS50229_07100 [Campylobacterota bacterium]|nr:hypothetical protein AGMMS50229_07100 [Campylobacterota bacterium]